MKHKLTISLVLLFATMMIQLPAFSQTLKKHQWKNRVLLVISNKENNEPFQKQMDEFSDEKPLNERKLVLYKVFPESYILEEKRINSSVLFEMYIKNKKDFCVVLIGLDGGVKLSQSNPLSSQDLFRIIDSMPMRRSEIRKK
ncbi:MAG: hypothetical protein ACI9IP_001763 [Arcticibacterium sp.]|jgi:hypothetical protein